MSFINDSLLYLYILLNFLSSYIYVLNRDLHIWGKANYIISRWQFGIELVLVEKTEIY